MPLLRPSAPFPVCPRCKAVLLYDAALCDQCGYQQPVNPMKAAAIQQRSVQSGYQVDYQPTSEMHLGRMPVERLPITGVQEGFQIGHKRTTGMEPGYQVNQLPVQDTSANRMPIQSIQAIQSIQPIQPIQPTQPIQPGYPFNTFAQYRQQPMYMPLPSHPMSAHQVEKDVRSHSQTRRALIYFTSVVLVTIVLIFVVFKEAGQSVLSLISHPTSTQSITKSYPLPKGTPLLKDSFVNDSTGWNLQSSPGNYTVSVGNGKLSLEDNKNSLLWELLPGEQRYDNFVLSVNATLSKGDPNNGYGVYIRGASNSQSDLATYYRFELYGDSSYTIFKGVTNQSGASTEEKLTNYIVNSAIQKQGKPNHIMIIAKGPSFSFIANGQLLTTITDHSYASGSIALFVSNLPGAKPGAQVQFSQLTIYPN